MIFGSNFEVDNESYVKTKSEGNGGFSSFQLIKKYGNSKTLIPEDRQ